MRVVVYTAIFGSIPDQLRPLPEFEKRDGIELQFFAHMDGIKGPQPHETGWWLMPAMWHHKDPRLRARRHKLLSHQAHEADITIWLDGCLTPVDHPLDLIDKYLQHNDICMFDHMQRKCIYDEARSCKKLKKDKGSGDRCCRGQVQA